MAAQSMGLTVSERPRTWADQPGSHLKVGRTAIEVAAAILRLRSRYGRYARTSRGPKSPQAARGAPVSVGLNLLALNWRWIDHPEAGGAEQNLFEHVMRWQRLGHRVTVVCAEGLKVEPSLDSGFDSGVKVIRMGGRYSVYARAALYLTTPRARV